MIGVQIQSPVLIPICSASLYTRCLYSKVLSSFLFALHPSTLAVSSPVFIPICSAFP
jgi:hypothetical protein